MLLLLAAAAAAATTTWDPRQLFFAPATAATAKVLLLECKLLSWAGCGSGGGVGYMVLAAAVCSMAPGLEPPAILASTHGNV